MWRIFCKKQIQRFFGYLCAKNGQNICIFAKDRPRLQKQTPFIFGHDVLSVGRELIVQQLRIAVHGAVIITLP